MPDPLTHQRSVMLVFYGCTALLAYLIYLLFQPFLTPLAWAAILAANFFRRYERLEGRFGKTAAATIGTVAVTLIIIVPVVLVAFAFIQEATQTIGQIDIARGSSTGLARVQRAWTWAQNQRLGQNLGSLDDFLNSATAWLAGLVATSAGALVSNAATLVVRIVTTLFALFFFFRDGDAIMARVRRLLPFDPSFRDRRIAEAADMIRASISAGLIVALVQGTLGGLTFAVLRLGAPVFWGVMMAFFALLPLGAWVIWGPVAGWLLLTGQTGRGVALIVIGAGVIGLVDNILRPILLSGKSQMNGLLVFISLLGGLAAFGLVGLVLGPVIMATTASFVDAYADEPTGDHLAN